MKSQCCIEVSRWARWPIAAAVSLAIAMPGSPLNAQSGTPPGAATPQAGGPPGPRRGGGPGGFPGGPPRPESKPGEIGYLRIVVNDQEKPPASSPPAPSDPHDFQGVWKVVESAEHWTVDGKEPPMNATGQNIWWQRRSMENNGTPIPTPATICEPPSQLPVLSGGTSRVIQTPERVVFVFQELHTVWSIHLNSEHPKKLEPTFMGHSVGHWDGNALVVDVVGFNDLTWLEYGGTPHSDALHMVVRISKIDENRKLQFLFSIDDPKMYTAPFTLLRRARWRPDMTVLESNCEAAQLDPKLIGR